jgi:hypothetical protein
LIKLALLGPPRGKTPERAEAVKKKSTENVDRIDEARSPQNEGRGGGTEKQAGVTAGPAVADRYVG